MSARSRNFACLTSAQLEEQLVRRRQAEFERLNFWNNNSTYFKTWEFNTSLYSRWASGSSSLENSEELALRKKRKVTLEERRQKLKKLLETEENNLAMELKKKSKKPQILVEDINAANVAFLLKEEEERRRERDIKMHHYWRQNQPSLKDFERRQHSDYVKRSWLQQVVEKRKEKEEEEKKMLESIKELKRIQEEQEQKEKELVEEKKRTEADLKKFLEVQIALVKCREEKENILKKEEIETIKLQNELEEMLGERKRLEEKKKQIDLSLFHKKQYQLLLKRRAKEIQDNLEIDRKFLDKIAQDEKYALGVSLNKVEKFKKDLDLARKIFKEQSEIEKLRTSQAEYLFDEEAKKVYEEQEAQWKLENESRKKLMDDVLKTLELQIKEKLCENLKAQEESRKEREEILKSVDKANSELKHYQEKTKQSLENWKKDLDQQILDKKLELYYKRKKQEEDKENELKAKREEEEKLCKELTKMYLSGYQPKTAARKKFTPF